MLQIADDVLGLNAPNEIAGYRACEKWVFTFVFKGASATRLAGQIEAAAQGHVVSLVAELVANQSSILECCFRVP